MKARDGEQECGKQTNPFAANLFSDAIQQRNGQHTKENGNKSPGKRIRAGDQIPKMQKPIMQRRMLVHCRAQCNPRYIFLREPDTPALVPPNVFIGEAIRAQKEREQENTIDAIDQ
jgi:hypothetical protein